MKAFSIFAATLLVVTLISVSTDAAGKFWTLDFKHTGLHYVNVGGQAVAYTTYTVTNNTGADRTFRPIFRVETETGKLTYAIAAPTIAPAIREKHGQKLLDVDQITGTIKDGETKLGLAVFFKLDPAADHVKVYIAGITDTFRYQDEDNRKGFQRREWFIHWFRPGDPVVRQEDRVDTLFNDWIWRSTGTAATAPEAPEKIETPEKKEAPEKTETPAKTEGTEKTETPAKD